MGKSWKDKHSSNKWDRQPRRTKNDQSKGKKPVPRHRESSDGEPDETAQQ
jgi:hypothetical protein